MFVLVEETTIGEVDAISILNKDESHFFDVTSKRAGGKVIQKKCCAFSNADGGEFYIGIIDKKNRTAQSGIFGGWEGFANQEEANSFIQNAFKGLSPGIEHLSFEFITIKNQETLGKVLLVSIEKSPNVQRTADNKVYVRKGAQCLEIEGQAIIDLQLSKGATSYENQLVANYGVRELYTSKALLNFLQEYSPQTNPIPFLRKQRLVQKVNGQEQAVYAGMLLYDENPSASLPKKCAVKISRYDTSEIIPLREHLKRQETVEAPLIEQISHSIRIVQQMIESVPIMGTTGLEKAKYPPEAIKEIIVNAIIHRDYNISDDVMVFVFNNRIEVHSPGVLPGHITAENILNERFARNPKIVRLLNKYPNPPNKDIGEGLNTAFQKMAEVRLKPPEIAVKDNRVVVTLPHQPLASPEEQIIEYLKNHPEITNRIARGITGIRSENAVKKHFTALLKREILERVPGKRGRSSAWRLKKA